MKQRVKSSFGLEEVKDDDKLFRFYTGFISFSVFLAFFEFLGPVVEKLNYWGSTESERKRHRTRKLDSKNQLFLTLVKLKLNLKLTDLAFRLTYLLREHHDTSQLGSVSYITTYVK